MKININFNTLYKLGVSFSLMFSIFAVPVKATSEETFYSKEEKLIKILDDYYINDSCYEFYDINGNVINKSIDNMEEDYLKDKNVTVSVLAQYIDSSLKIEDINSNLREIVPGGGGGSSGVYKTKKLTYSKDFFGYGYADFTFTGRIRVADYLEWIDTNISNPQIVYDLYDKYDKRGNNLLVAFDSYLPCYGSNYCSIYHYVVQYRVSLYIANLPDPAIRNNQLENVHVPIWARDYQWFNNSTEFYAGL